MTGDRRSKKSCSHRTDLLPIYHGWWKLEQEALAGIGVPKVSPSRRLNKENGQCTYVGPLTKLPPTLLSTDYYTPMKHDDCSSPRPDTGHLLFTDHYASTWSKSPLAFSKRSRAPIDLEDTFPFPYRSYRSLKYISSVRTTTSISTCAVFFSIRSTLYLSVEAIVTFVDENENRILRGGFLFPMVGDRVER